MRCRDGWLRGALLVAAAAAGCRTIAGIDDKMAVEPSTGGGASSSSSGGPGGAMTGGAGGTGGAPCVGALDDAMNCGACGHDCEGGACKGGQCQPYTLAFTGGSRGSGLSVPGDGHVYYGAYDDREIRKLDDGVPHQDKGDLIAMLSGAVGDVAAGGGYVYATAYMGGASTPIVRVDTLGNGQIPLDGSWLEPEGIALGKSSLFVVTDANCVVGRVPLDGSASAVIYTVPGGRCYQVAIDDTHVYFADEGLGRIVRVPQDAPDVGAGDGTANAQVLDASGSGPFPIAVDGTHVYWSSAAGTYRLPKDGAGARETLIDDPTENTPWSLGVDDTHVYYAVPGFGGTGVVARVKKQAPAGAPEILATDQDGAVALHVTPGAVYWIAQFDYRIMKLVR